MSERYPSDNELLAIAEDATTGVEYVETGKSPYFIEFRRMLFRLLLASQRANDLRLYQDGDLSVGLRAGRCLVGSQAHEVATQEGLPVTVDAASRYWIDDAGVLQTAAQFPSDRSTYIPIAEVIAGPVEIESVTDLRGEAFLQAPSAALVGLAASGDEINQALDGIGPTVTPSGLDTVTAGPFSVANNHHTHTVLGADEAGTANYKLVNYSDDPTANVAIAFSSTERFLLDTYLTVNPANNFLQQQYAGNGYNLVGVLPVTFLLPSEITQGMTDQFIGVVPISGRILSVCLSVGENLESSESTDGLECDVKVNGTSSLSTAAALASADGPGFKSTAQGDGTPAIINLDASREVQKGDLLYIDLNRTAAGTISKQATNAAVCVVIAADGPA